MKIRERKLRKPKIQTRTINFHIKTILIVEYNIKKALIAFKFI
jgi:hypothetical protein